jgi:hypothetical protein
VALINIDLLRQAKGNVKIDKWLGLRASLVCGAVSRDRSTAEVEVRRAVLLVDGCELKLRACKTGRSIDEFLQ